MIESTSIPSAGWGEASVDKTEIVYEGTRDAAGRAEIHDRRPPHRHRRRQPRHLGRAIGIPESPLLQRPDLLKSLLGYWLNHPSLSYLFSGLVHRPHEQHPRIDEARKRCAARARGSPSARSSPAAETPPWSCSTASSSSGGPCWSTATGNTHRSEFCIDKLFTPRTPRPSTRAAGDGRLPEMPPHWRMSVKSSRRCVARPGLDLPAAARTRSG